VTPFLARAIAARALGYQPIPAFHAYLSPEERMAAAETLRHATRALLDRMTDDELLEEVVAMQAEWLADLGQPAAESAASS